MDLYIGIDIGTSKIAGIVLDKELRTHTYIEKKHTGWIEKGIQDPLKILEMSTNLLKSLLTQYREENIKGIGITGQMHGIVLLDNNYNPISPLFTWQYVEPAYYLLEKTSFLEKINKELREKISNLEELGCIPQAGYGGLTYYFLKKTNNLPVSTSYITSIYDLFAHRITDAPLSIDPTTAASFGIFNVKRWQWHTEVMEYFGISPEILPELKDTGTIIGKLKDSLCKKWNIYHRIPICVGIGDNQAAFLGGVEDPSKDSMLIIGTGAQLNVPIKEWKYIEGIEVRPSYKKNEYLMVAASLCGGYTWELLMKFVKELLEEYFKFTGLSCKTTSYQVYSFLNQYTNQGANGILVKPYFLGRRDYLGMKGSIENLTPENFNIKSLTGAFIDSIIWQFLEYQKKIEKCIGKKIEEYYITGGTFDKIKNLIPRTSKILGRNIRRSYSNSTARGAAIIAKRSIEEK